MGDYYIFFHYYPLTYVIYSIQALYFADTTFFTNQKFVTTLL